MDTPAPTLKMVLRYAITEGPSANENAQARRERLLGCANRWAQQDIAYAQLREKDLEAGELLLLAEAMRAVFREAGAATKLLVNGRADIAAAAGADGVHLTAHTDELIPQQVRDVFSLAGAPAPVVSVSCHTLAEVARARDANADILLFGPVFEKRVGGQLMTEGLGLEVLRAACESAQSVSVFALGGVTEASAALCLQAGAAGVAGIRMAKHPLAGPSFASPDA